MSYRGENTECKVYVGDLPKDAEEKELERAFGYYGHIKSVWVAHNPPGFAFIEYDDPKDAEDAVRALDGNTICGVKARVEHATGKIRQKPWQRDGGGGGGGRGFGADRYGGGGGGSYGGMRRDPNDRCFKCGERGHHSRECRSGGRGGGGGYGGGDRSSGSRRRRSPSRSRSRDRSPRRRSVSKSVSRSRSRERVRRD